MDCGQVVDSRKPLQLSSLRLISRYGRDRPRAGFKTVWERGTVPFCSRDHPADGARRKKLGQSPTVLKPALARGVLEDPKSAATGSELG